MKILAIRGENLASLTHSFSIDFTTGRLGDSGLFAITGNTGSGKSTLLDAMCLALYDQIARLPANKKNLAEIGHSDDPDRLKANDVRQILSRGAAAGFAEVDFIGRDGETYRARWSVRRARNRPDGKCQKQERSLQHLAGATTYAGGQRDVQAQIDEKLGLSWEQFRRAVILPQGDFAAFLKSSVDERSALLERMTGTEHYSKISVAAYERAKAERQKLEQLTDKLSDQPVFTPEDKEALTIQTQQLELQQKKLSQQTAMMNEWVLMQQRLQEMQINLSDAKNQFQEKEQEWLEHHHSREQLIQLEKVQSVRAEHEQLDQVVLELKTLDSQVSAFTEQLSSHLLHEEPLSKRLQQLMQTHVTKEEQFIELQRDIRQARELDQRLLDKQQHLEQAKAQFVALQNDVQRQQSHYQNLNQDYEYATANRAQLTQWLESNKFWQRQAQQQQPLLVMMNDFVAEQKRWQQEQQKQVTSNQQLRELQTFLHQSETRLSQFQESMHSFDLRLEQLGVAPDLQLLQKQQQQLQQLQGLTERCYQLRVLTDQSHQQIRLNQELSLQLQQVATALEQLTARKKHIEPELESYKTQIEAVRNSLTQARLRSDLAELRVYLKDEEACPLCGSLHHPVMQNQPVNEQNLLLQLEQQHRFLQQQLEIRLAEMSQLEEGERHHLKAQNELERRLLTSNNTIQQSEEQWLHIRHGYEQSLPEWPTTTEQLVNISVSLAENHQRWMHEFGLLQQETEQNHLIYQRQQQLLQQKEQHEIQFRQTEKQVIDVRFQVTELQNRLAEIQQQQTQRQQRLQALEQTLAEQLSPLNWHEHLIPHYAEQWITQWQQQCQLYLQREQQLQASEQAFRQLEQELQGLTQQIRVLHEQLVLREQEFKHQQTEYHAITVQRQECLNGQAADKVEQQAKSVLSELQQEIEVAREQQRLWQEQRIALQAKVENSRQSQLQLQDKQRALLRQTMQQQVQLGMSEYDIRQLLITPIEQVRLLREQLAVLDEQLSQAKTRVHERTLNADQQQKRCEDLLASQPQWQTMSHEVMLQRFDDLKCHLNDVEQLLYEYRHLMQQMVQNNEQQQALLAEIQKQQQTSDTWQQLNELIGSASGAKFRTFAQSLTLEQLLLLANQHLNDLAPRYQLQRVPGTDLALQAIDRDMGDDIRAVESLSGGESFLVSLALALGLSSLTANDTRIESLFIDEGFGTLDPESLDTAIASLDALQAAGRQVGVISHVQTLVERIGVQIRVQSLGGGESRVILP